MSKVKDSLDKVCQHCEKILSRIPVPDHPDGDDIHHCGHAMCPFRVMDGEYCDEINEANKEFESLQEINTSLGQQIGNLMKERTSLVNSLDVSRNSLIKMGNACSGACEMLSKSTPVSVENGEKVYWTADQWKNFFLLQAEERNK